MLLIFCEILPLLALPWLWKFTYLYFLTPAKAFGLRYSSCQCLHQHLGSFSIFCFRFVYLVFRVQKFICFFFQTPSYNWIIFLYEEQSFIVSCSIDLTSSHQGQYSILKDFLSSPIYFKWLTLTPTHFSQHRISFDLRRSSSSLPHLHPLLTHIPYSTYSRTISSFPSLSACAFFQATSIPR